MDDDQICFVDIETTGLNHTQHVPWEVAVIRDDEEYVWQVELLPGQLLKADKESLEICRFGERYVGDEPGRAVSGHFPPIDGVDHELPIGALVNDTIVLTPAASAFAWGKLTAGRRIVGCVPSFDELMMRHQWASVYGWSRDFPWHYQTIDVEAVAMGYALRCEHEMTGSGFPDEVTDPMSGNFLSEYFSVAPPTPEERHTALGDARWAKRLWNGVMS